MILADVGFNPIWTFQLSGLVIGYSLFLIDSVRIVKKLKMNTWLL